MSLSTRVAALSNPTLASILGGDSLAGFPVVSQGQAGVDFFPVYPDVSDFTNLNQNVDMSGDGMVDLNAFWIRPTGLQMFTVERSTDELREWSMSPAFDLTTLAFVQVVSLDASAFTTDIQFSPDGTSLWLVDNAGIGVQRYILSTPWDITTLGAVSTFNITNMSDGALCIGLASDGSRVLCGNGDDVRWFEYDMSSAFDISTMAIGSTQTQSESGTIYTTRFHGLGTQVYKLDRGPDTIDEYTITDFDITTEVLFDTGIDMATPAGFALIENFQFNPDGSEVFVMEGGVNTLGIAGYTVP